MPRTPHPSSGAGDATLVISPEAAAGRAAEKLVLEALDTVLEKPASEHEAAIAGLGLPPSLELRLRQLLAQHQKSDFLQTAGGIPASLPLSLPQPGSRVGNYCIQRLLGAGGMGVVYLAERDDGVYAQTVAIKLLQPTRLVADAQQRERLLSGFDDERAILAQLQHPNIVRILDGGRTEDGVPYLVMEYVNGVDLLSHCHRRQLDVEARLRLFAKVCQAVQEAHRHLIVHRDLKPGNVLVDGQDMPHLLDFGIAKLVDPLQAAQADAQSTVAAMTPAYASPEQIRHKPITTASDIYSLGVILYELLAGRRPYQSHESSPGEIERAISELDPPTLSRALHQHDAEPGYAQLPRHLPADLERIVAKALHREPARRYGSAQELADDLERFLLGQPIKARPDTWLYRTSKFLARNRLASALAGLALALVLGSAAVAVHQAKAAEQRAREAIEMSNFLLEVLSQANIDTVGSEPSMAEVLKAAAERIDTYFLDRPAAAASIRHVIGNSLMSLYQLDEAEAKLRTGLDEARAAYGPVHATTLGIANSLAWMAGERGHPEEAASLYREQIERLRQHGLTRIAAWPRTWNDLGRLYLVHGDYDQASQAMAQAISAIEADATLLPEDEQATIFSNQAQILHGLQQLDAADALYEKAIAMIARVHGEDNREQAFMLNNQAILAWDQGNRERALDLASRSVQMRKRVYRHAHPDIAHALTNVALMAKHMQHLDLALESIDDAILTLDQLDIPTGENHVKAHAVRSGILLDLGQSQAAEAELTWLDTHATKAPIVSEPTRELIKSLREVIARTP